MNPATYPTSGGNNVARSSWNLLSFMNRPQPFLGGLPVWIVFVLIVLFSGLSVYFLTKFNNVDLKENSAVESDPANNTLSTSSMKVSIFTATWCPACTSKMNIIDDFVNKFNKKVVNGCLVNAVNTDISDEDKMKATMSKYGLDGVPSVVAEKNGKVFKFDAAVTASSLKQFVEKVAAA